ncbi:MAG: SMI1/KNR4 family protein [Planctomycetaceae bacterium]|nr:SMI1/KNR4 family protein [Planctomycetaceae bacterium]
MIDETETRLGIVIPKSLKEQLLIQNGGYIVHCDNYPFESDSLHWTNATVDGIDQLDGWKRAKDDHWFESVEDVNDLHLLIRIASHSESQLCLDYRKTGPDGIPGVTYIDTAMNPIEIRIVAFTVDDFIRGLVSSRLSDDNV